MASWSDIKHHDYYRKYEYENDELHLQKYELCGDVAAKMQSGEFVTPAVLAELQRKKGQDPRDPNLKGVAPFPPRRTKEEIFDAAKYRSKDAYAASVLPQPTESPDSFGKKLFKLCHSNLDKVRAGFYFVCTANVDQLQQEENETQLYTWIREMRSSNNQSGVFEQLMEVANVPYKPIWGMKKGAGYEPGKKASGRGPWCACYVEGEWRFVDAHWGSESLTGYDAGTHKEVTEEGDVKGGTKSSGTTVYSCNEYYFLTDPEKLAMNHLPKEEDKEWQLLARPLTEDEFVQMPLYFQGSMDASQYFKLAPASHPLNVIVAAPGNIEILLQELGCDQYEYTSELKIHNKWVTEETKKVIKENVNVNGFISKPMRMHGQVKFRFVPPCKGKFLLTIKLRRHAGGYIHTHSYLPYTIHCPQAAQNVKQQPQGEEQLNEFGAGAAVAQSGLESEECGEMKAEDGEQQLVVKETDGRRHRLQCRVKGTDADVPQSHILLWKHETENYFIFLAPDSGAYAMVVYDNDTPICQYLVDAASEPRDGDLPLPDFSKFGGLGQIDEAMAKLVQPVSHERPYIVCEESQLEIKLRISVELRVEVRAQLVFLQSDGAERPSDSFALVNGSVQGANVDLRFQRAGNYVLQLAAKEQSEENSAEESFKPFYNYFIRALGELDGSAAEFPEVSDRWSSCNRIVEPKKRILPINEVIKFNLHIKDPSINFVYVVNKATDEKVGLLPNAEGAWTGQMKAYKASEGAEVSVIGGPDRDSCEELLRYKFASPSDKEEQEQRKKEAEELNKQREDKEKKRKRKQENHELQEKGQETLPEDPVAEEQERQRKEEERKQQEEERRKQKEEEEKAKKKKEAEERRQRQAQEKKEAQEKKKKEEEERKKKEEEERQQKEEEEKQRKENERQQKREQQQQKEEKQRQKKENEKKKKLQSREYYLDKMKQEEEEKKQKKEEKKKRKEEKEKKREEKKKKEKEKQQAEKRRDSLAKVLSKSKVDEEALKSAIDEIKAAGKQGNEDEEMVAYGERYLDAMQLKEELAKENKKAEKSKETKKLKDLLKKIEDEKFSNGLMEKIKPEMDRARQLMEHEEKMQKQPQHRMDCDKQAMMELRKYNNPPAIVQRVVQGVLLLLGHYEVETRNWKRSQKLLGGTLKEINNGEPKDLHPGIAARADQLLASIDRRQLAQVSPAATALFDWAVPVVQRAKSNAKSGSFKPATEKDQRKILNVSMSEHNDYEWQDNPRSGR